MFQATSNTRITNKHDQGGNLKWVDQSLIGGGVADNKLSLGSYHPLTNNAATEEFLRQQALLNTTKTELEELINQANIAINAVKAMRATTTSVGMVQLSTSASATDPNAGALSITEKNATINDSLANRIHVNRTQISQNINSINNINELLTAYRSQLFPYRGGIDCNEAVYNGIYIILPQVLNRPSFDWGTMIVVTSNNYVMQLAMDVLNGNLFHRGRTETKWSNWWKVNSTAM